jgi:hypothetical protein
MIVSHAGLMNCRRDLNRDALVLRAGSRRFRDARLQRLLDYWIKLRSDEDIPERSAFDCTSIPTLLPFVWLCRVEADSGRFQFRLAGEEIRSLFGRPVAGSYVDDLLPSIAGQLQTALAAILNLPAACYFYGTLCHDYLTSIGAESLALPLCDGSRPSTILGATVFSWLDRPALDDMNPRRTRSEIVPISEL